MYTYHLDELIKKKEIEENRKLSDTQLADAIGISRQTFGKIKNYHINEYVTSTDVLEKILKYFQCKKITELIEYEK